MGTKSNFIHKFLPMSFLEILKDEYGLSPEEIKLKSADSGLFIGETKSLREAQKSD